jgi:hypothetical protein
MKAEDRSKLRSLIGDVSGLKSRTPDAKKFSDWKKDVEKKFGEAYGSGSEELSRFRRIRFFDFEGHGRSKEAPLSESERAAYVKSLDEAQRLLQRLV